MKKNLSRFALMVMVYLSIPAFGQMQYRAYKEKDSKNNSSQKINLRSFKKGPIYEDSIKQRLTYSSDSSRSKVNPIRIRKEVRVYHIDSLAWYRSNSKPQKKKEE